jgi:hypothetical protein
MTNLHLVGPLLPSPQCDQSNDRDPAEDNDESREELEPGLVADDTHEVEREGGGTEAETYRRGKTTGVRTNGTSEREREG